jgi:enoyl-CoA hydratase/carnithine racemase
MSLSGLKELSEAFANLRDDELWAGVVTGVGGEAFSCGVNINEVLPFLKQSCSLGRAALDEVLRSLGLDLWKPLIAALNWTLGGGLGLALCGDIRIA